MMAQFDLLSNSCVYDHAGNVYHVENNLLIEFIGVIWTFLNNQMFISISGMFIDDAVERLHSNIMFLVGAWKISPNHIESIFRFLSDYLVYSKILRYVSVEG